MLHTGRSQVLLAILPFSFVIKQIYLLSAQVRFNFGRKR